MTAAVDFNGRDCPQCGAPTPYRSPACGYCRTPLAWPDGSHVRVGDPIVGCDPTRGQPLPGALAGEKLGLSGIRVEVAGNTMKRAVWAHRLCDAAVAVTGVALDARARLGVCARFSAEGNESSCYVAFVNPGTRTLHLRRVYETAKHYFFEALNGGAEVCARIAPVGATNRVELRCVDALLEVHVNGGLALSVVDARYGYGKFGLVVGALAVEDGERSAVEIQRLELAHIA